MAPNIDRADTTPIPQPKAYPFVGNLWDVDRTVPLRTFTKLADQYGPIFALQFPGKRRIFVNSVALASEICDEKRFTKAIPPGLQQLRFAVGSGLFTAWTHEHDWELAHRVLVPAFGPLNLQSMFGQMKDIISQCMLKWARFGPESSIDVASDWTRLTLDTLALCAMGYRFNSFYSEQMHPFVAAFTRSLELAGSRATRPPMMSVFHKAEDAEYVKSINYQRELCKDLIQQRKSHPTEHKDLLTAMIDGKDPKTGEGLSESLIIDNMITFLVAGHETTSGMLAFATYYLLKTPSAYRRAQQEIDEVIGTDSFGIEHLKKLPYLNAVLRESLRLSPTAPIFSLETKDPAGEVIGGSYLIKSDDAVSINVTSVQRDPSVYGEDANEFKPERMLEENMKERLPHAWLPFGNGARACIGRHFAWQEAIMALAMCLQRFDLEMEDPQYKLEIKHALTQKPIGFHMKARLREGVSATSFDNMANSTSVAKSSGQKMNGITAEPEASQPITIFYGSNCGTCEAFARTLATDAPAHGFQASQIATLDSAKGKLPTDQPIIIITASYEGQPCDNAKHFVSWLDQLDNKEKLDISYAVFGAGHSDWKATFHKIPKAIDEGLATHGGKRLCKMGTANAANGDIMSEFQAWEDETLWPALAGHSDKPTEASTTSTANNLTVEVSHQRASKLQAGVYEAKVVEAKTLTAPGVPEKRHLEIKLPSAMTYNAGDYLAILPFNPQQNVHRVLKRFGLAWDAILTIRANANTMLPTGHPIGAYGLFSAYVELSQPATKRDLSMLMEATQNDSVKHELQCLAETLAESVTKKRISLLDLLDRFPTIELPLNAFIGALVPMRVRQYSISSSPLKDPTTVTITYSVLDQIAMSRQGRYQGVASTFLSNLEVGDSLHVAVKASNQAFHLPSAADSVPIIMVAAGSGIAPFRGFVQERAAQIGAGRKLAPAHLFIGARHPEQDDLYRDEFDRWEEMGAVKVHRAFSRAPETSNGCKYVQDALGAEKTLLQDLWDANAKVFVCGSRQVGESVREASLAVFKDGWSRKGNLLEEADERATEWFERVRNERFATDVFA